MDGLHYRIGAYAYRASRSENGVDIRGGINGETLIDVVVAVHDGGRL